MDAGIDFTENGITMKEVATGVCNATTENDKAFEGDEQTAVTAEDVATGIDMKEPYDDEPEATLVDKITVMISDAVPTLGSEKSRFLAMDVVMAVCEHTGIVPQMEFAAKRARTIITDDDKLRRLRLRVAGSARAVEQGEVQQMIELLKSFRNTVESLKDDANFLQMKIYERTLPELREIRENLPTHEEGKGRAIKLGHALGMIVPALGKLEVGIATTKAMFNELNSAAMIALANAYHTFDDENAKLSVKQLREALDGAIREKEDEAIQRAVVAQAAQHYHEAFHQAVTAEVQRRLSEQNPDQDMGA